MRLSIFLSCTCALVVPLAVPQSKLHERNRHICGYDIAQLAQGYPRLKEYVIDGGGDGTRAHTIDFSRPAAVEALNAALLTVDYGIHGFALPGGYLCPAVPGRADLLHVIADLLATDNDGSIPTGRAVRGLDIGVGASCIYPLIGHAEYGWAFLGSDVSKTSIASASAIAQANDTPVELRRQPRSEHVLAGVLQPSDGCVAFTLCNPPFYASAQEEAAAAARKWRGLQKKKGRAKNVRGSTRSFGGSKHELWCAGGEKQFVTTHIRESAQMAHAALWFTSLVSSDKSLPKLLAELSNVNPARVEQLGVATGNKAMRVLAWSFMEDAQRQERLKDMLTRQAAAGELDEAACCAQQQQQQTVRPEQASTAQRMEATRRACLSILAAALGLGWPAYAHADLASAGANGLPLVGRFEKLKGANAIIGSWKLYCTDGPSGALSFLRDGDVELRSEVGQLVGTGVSPWTYKPKEKGSPIVLLSFSIDVAGGEWDVLYFLGALDTEGGPERGRRLEGSLSTGFGRKVGDFVAVPISE